VTVTFDVPDSVFERASIPNLPVTLQQVTEPDLEKLGYCLKCGTRPCTWEQKHGEEKTG